MTIPVPPEWVAASAGRVSWSVVRGRLDPSLAGLVAPPVVVRAAPLAPVGGVPAAALEMAVAALDARRVAPARPRAPRRPRAVRAR